jgi:hypothetical protein
MSEGHDNQNGWPRAAFWAIMCVAAGFVFFLMQDDANDYVLLAAFSVMLLSPFIAIGVLAGYPRVWLVIGLAVLGLYWLAFVLVNFGGFQM